MRMTRLAVIFTAILTSAAAQPRNSAPPNIVLITIDTLRADHLHCYGYQQIRTPNIDRLAAEGTRFTTVITAAPLTLPAHCSIMTGTYPMFHGVRDNVGYRLDPGTETLAQILKQHGYATGAFVGAYVLDRAFGLGTGFDFYYDHFEAQTGPRDTINLAQLKRPGKEVVDQALAWIEKTSGRPFFAWIHLYDPHDPYDPPAPFKSEYAAKPYDGEIAYADQQVGRILAYLNSKGLYGKTLISLTADHGESLGEHKELRHGYFVYDATVLVPWILKPPTVSPRPRVVTEEVRSIDIAPTILQVLGYPKGKIMQGDGLSDLMSGKMRETPPETYSESFYPRQFGWSGLRTLRVGKTKYIDAPRPELYQLDVDPKELNNRVQDYPAVVSDLRARLQALDKASASPDSQSKAVHALSPEQIEKLARLGYLGARATPVNSSLNEDLADPKDMIDIFYELNRAGLETADGDCDHAIPTLTSVIGKAPRIPAAYLMLGRCYFMAERYTDAKSTFQDLLKVDPQSSDAWFYIAASQFHLGALDDAEAGMKRILAANPQRMYAHKYLGFVYQAKGEPGLAIDEFSRVLEVLPNDLESHGKLGFLLASTSHLQEALPHFEKVVALAPDDASAHFNLGIAYEKLGELSKAKREFDLACKLDKTVCEK